MAIVKKLLYITVISTCSSYNSSAMNINNSTIQNSNRLMNNNTNIQPNTNRLVINSNNLLTVQNRKNVFDGLTNEEIVYVIIEICKVRPSLIPLIRAEIAKHLHRQKQSAINTSTTNSNVQLPTTNPLIPQNKSSIYNNPLFTGNIPNTSCIKNLSPFTETISTNPQVPVLQPITNVLGVNNNQWQIDREAELNAQKNNLKKVPIKNNQDNVLGKTGDVHPMVYQRKNVKLKKIGIADNAPKFDLKKIPQNVYQTENNTIVNMQNNQNRINKIQHYNTYSNNKAYQETKNAIDNQRPIKKFQAQYELETVNDVPKSMLSEIVIDGVTYVPHYMYDDKKNIMESISYGGLKHDETKYWFSGSTLTTDTGITFKFQNNDRNCLLIYKGEQLLGKLKGVIDFLSQEDKNNIKASLIGYNFNDSQKDKIVKYIEAIGIIPEEAKKICNEFRYQITDTCNYNKNTMLDVLKHILYMGMSDTDQLLGKLNVVKEKLNVVESFLLSNDKYDIKTLLSMYNFNPVQVQEIEQYIEAIGITPQAAKRIYMEFRDRIAMCWKDDKDTRIDVLKYILRMGMSDTERCLTTLKSLPNWIGLPFLASLDMDINIIREIFGMLPTIKGTYGLQYGPYGGDDIKDMLLHMKKLKVPNEQGIIKILKKTKGLNIHHSNINILLQYMAELNIDYSIANDILDFCQKYKFDQDDVISIISHLGYLKLQGEDTINTLHSLVENDKIPPQNIPNVLAIKYKQYQLQNEQYDLQTELNQMRDMH